MREIFRTMPLVGKLAEKGPKVAVVRMAGVISDMMRRPAINYVKHAKLLNRAFDKRGIAAVALCINSPGGAPAQSSLIATTVRQLAAEKNMPVFAFVEDVAASGGYWLACAADEIYAQDTSIVGSIGVISAGFGFEDFIERHGVHRRLHTAGGQKSFLDPFRPEKPEDVARLKALQSDMHGSFIAWVKARRAGKLTEDDAVFDGSFWTGKAALTHGLIDGVGDMRGVLRDKFGDKVRLIPVEAERKWQWPPGLPFGADIPADLADMLDERAVRGRYGL